MKAPNLVNDESKKVRGINFIRDVQIMNGQCDINSHGFWLSGPRCLVTRTDCFVWSVMW